MVQSATPPSFGVTGLDLPQFNGQGSDGNNIAIIDSPTQHDKEQFDPFAPILTQDFAAYLDSVPCLNGGLPPSFPPLSYLFPNPPLPSTIDYGITSTRSVEQSLGDAERLTPGASDEPSLSRYGSRLPSLQPDDVSIQNRPGHRECRDDNIHLVVTVELRQQIVDELARFRGCVKSGFILPSRHALTRFIAGYFRIFHKHYPFFHVPTLDLNAISAELLLAIAALGARYTRDPDIGIELFHVARAVVLERINRRRKTTANSTMRQQMRAMPDLQADTLQSTTLEKSRDSYISDDASEVLDMMQTVLIIIAIATWYKDEPGAADALSLRSVLHSLAREDKTRWSQAQALDDWKSWIRSEIAKRLQIVIFCFFSIHTILFDLPPMMLARELNVELPSSEAEWKASNKQEWHEARKSSGLPRHDFQESLINLFDTGEASWENSQLGNDGFSALGGCALIHAIIQQIWLVRNAYLPHRRRNRHGLPIDNIDVFENALKRWSRFWERNQESSMDPISPHGPVTFTSTALLRLAYIRLHLDLGPVRSLSSWDAHTVAMSLHHSPGVQRSHKLTRASLHCAHALSIPIKLGINYVAETQLIHWSNQHALCSLECAVLLAKWLDCVTMPNPQPVLTIPESQVLSFVAQLVAETEYSMTRDQVLLQKERLSGTVVRLWARLYQSSSVWQMVNLIGSSLWIYADLLENRRS